MEKDKMESLLIDYIDGRLSPEDRVMVEQSIAQDASVGQLYQQLKTVMSAMDSAEEIEPGQRLRNSFDRMLSEEIAKGKPSKTVFFQPVIYRMAAGIVLLIAAVYAGNAIIKSNRQEADLQALRKEVESTKQMMLIMLDNQQSASQRIQGVNVALGIEKADDDVVQALAKTMNEDPNTNVRLAALDALSKFHEEPGVRKLLIGSLSKQNDPIVQIALIQLMVRMKEKGAIKDLEKIIDDTNSMKAVKDEAYSGLLKLS